MCHILGWTIGDVFGNSQVVEHPLARGKLHIHLEVNEQKITAFGTPDQIDQHILNCIQKFCSPTGGLSLHYTAYLGTPISSVESVVRARDKHHNSWN